MPFYFLASSTERFYGNQNIYSSLGNAQYDPETKLMWPNCQPMDKLAGSIPGRGLLPGWTSQNSLISGPSSSQIQSGQNSYHIQSGSSSYQLQSEPHSHQIQSPYNVDADEFLPIDLAIARRDTTGQDCREYISTAWLQFWFTAFRYQKIYSVAACVTFDTMQNFRTLGQTLFGT